MSFNFRLVQGEDVVKDKANPEIDGDVMPYLAIYEVYYDEEGRPDGYSERPVVVGNNLEDLKAELVNIMTAFDLPVLEMKDLEKLEALEDGGSIKLY